MTKRTKRLLALMAAKPKLRRVSGLPPLSYTAKKAGVLTDYRIYGQTVDGESVGDRTGNLFDGEVELGSWDINTQPCSKIDAYNVRIRNANFIKVAENSTYSVTMSAEENVRLLIHFLDAQRNYISETTWLNNISNFNTPSQCEYINIIFKKGNNEAIALSDISNIMLNTGSTPLPYEPYGYKVPVTVEGKNLLQNTATSQTINGVTFTVNSDGSVTCNGTATAAASIVLTAQLTLNQGSYILTGCPQGGGLNTNYKLDIIDPIASVVVALDTGSGASLTIRQNMQARIVIYTGQVCDNLTFYPMIRKADIEDDTYEPYQPPVTTNLYLPEQIRKVGDEAEYIDYGEQKQHRVRKNLLNILANTAIVDGIHFTVNSDKSITIVGNLNASKADLYLITTDSLILNRGEYLVSCENANTNAKFIIGGSPSTGYVPYTEIIDSNSVEVSCSGGGIGYCLIRVTSDIENPITLYPMIRLASIEDDTYEPYITNTELDVTLPALPTLTGTNVLSVGTTVQPSEVEIEGRIKPVVTGGGE